MMQKQDYNIKAPSYITVRCFVLYVNCIFERFKIQILWFFIILLYNALMRFGLSTIIYSYQQ